MRYERTLSREIAFDGIGLHTGKSSHLRLLPAPAGSGRVFVRTDLGGMAVPATIAHVGRANYATCLIKDGVRISTAEHLLAALYALGVDNVRIELDSDEVPIMDGSAAPFVTMIAEAGIVEQSEPRRYITISRPIELHEE